ncbi:MAG: HlyD family efflux transporter periplasmic adaptor subunit [Verrucomicrobia bacterium]|nr:HlyD family efflux transporter periplasmic adaptor subunit [Verrucomicrobiota bacterium]
MSSSQTTKKPDFEAKPKKRSKKLKPLFTLTLGIGIVVLAFVLSLAAWNVNEEHPRTDDGVARANVIGIAPRISGPIVKLNVRDNQQVKSGELLFEIDPADYQLAVDRAQAALSSLDQQIEVAKTQDAQLKYQVKAAEDAVQQATAERDQVADTLHRLEPLLPKGFTTKEQVDETRTKLASADAQVAQAKEKLNQARVAVSSLGTLQAERPGAVATLGTAQLQLSYTKVVAPFDGQVVGLNISEGAYAHAGVEVFSFLDSRTWYVLANFRERELKSIQPGMTAEVYLLSNPDRRFEGTVEGISPAVQSQEDNVEIKGLPFVKRDLNWVRIAQRFPVRIVIKNPDPDIFRMGTTAVTTIKGFTETADKK